MTFDEFWELYPKKVAKQDALKAWGQLTMFDVVEIENVYELHCRSWRGKDPKWVPHAAAWLRKRRFEDDMSHEAQAQRREFFRIHGWLPES